VQTSADSATLGHSVFSRSWKTSFTTFDAPDLLGGIMSTRRSFLKKVGALAATAATPQLASGNEGDLSPGATAPNDAKGASLGAVDPTQELGTYLARMPELSDVVKQAIASGERSFSRYTVLLVHHLTGEVLGVIAALRNLGCSDIVTVFVGYNPDAERVYRPDLENIPSEELRCYILSKDSTGINSPYFIPRTFVKQPVTDSTAALDALDQTMKDKNLDFLAAMRALIVYVGLAGMARARDAGRRVLIIEDGGYTSPIFNDASLAGLSVAQMRARHVSPPDDATDAALPAAMKDVFSELVLGAVEHTRNGYDMNMRTFATYGKLAAPVFSIAVSYLRTQVESETVAATILNAVESVLYSQGVDLRDRKIFVFGGRGNVGRRLMVQLRARLDAPIDTLIGCDLKIGRPDTKTELPAWQYRQGSLDHPQITDKECQGARRAPLRAVAGSSETRSPAEAACLFKAGNQAFPRIQSSQALTRSALRSLGVAPSRLAPDLRIWDGPAWNRTSCCRQDS
jgi:hypothetical protein